MQTEAVMENSIEVPADQLSRSMKSEIPLFKKVFRSGISLPERRYYHDVTFDPIGLSEWLFNLKDNDYDSEWRSTTDTSVRSKQQFKKVVLDSQHYFVYMTCSVLLFIFFRHCSR